jgi:GTP-binding protein HflX
VPYATVALVGYTNAGKSTLFNRLTGDSVLARDMLFATLDPTMRAIALPDGRRAILSDTVGFIAELPTQLVAAFRATLEEVLDADLILHVRDITHPESELQAQNVRTILAELGIDETAQGGIIEVWNKLDRLAPDQAEAMRQIAVRTPRVQVISATTGEGVPELLTAVATDLAEPAEDETIRVGFEQGRQRAWLFDRKLVRSETRTDDGFELAVRWTERDRSQFQQMG